MMACNVITGVWKLDLTPQQKLVLLAFADHASEDGRDAFPKLSRVADMTGFHINTVRKYVQQLLKLGHMKVQEKRLGRSTNYHVLPNLPLHSVVGVEDTDPYTLAVGVENTTPTPQSVDHPYNVVESTPTPQAVDITTLNHKGTDSSGDEAVEKSSYDWPGMLAAVEKTFGVRGAQVKYIANLLLGRATTGEWGKHNLSEPMTPEQVVGFGPWYRNKYPDRSMVEKPPKIQSEAMLYLESQSANAQGSHIIHIMDTAKWWREYRMKAHDLGWDRDDHAV